MLDIIESALNTAFSNGRVTDSESFHEELKRAIKTVSMLGYGEDKRRGCVIPARSAILRFSSIAQWNCDTTNCKSL
ncbi:hypothetical protein F6Y05_21510 [Bacillus megaterium]|nr:hypothetical protein [Priestia megaterium]